MYVSVEGNHLTIDLSPDEKRVLLGLYQNSLTSVAIGIQKELNTWVDARMKLKNENDMRDLATLYQNASTDKQKKIMELLSGIES